MPDRLGRILVVDDERGMRVVCRRSLEAAGHQVTAVESGEAALEVFKPGEFDLVLTDLMMPGMSGLDLLVRLLEVDPDLACVMMTAHATIETAVEAIRRGAYNYVAKPFTSVELVAIVEKALEVRWLTLESARLREEAERNLLLLTAERSRVLTIVRSMVDGVLVINREGSLVLYNPALLRLLGIKDVPELGAAPSAAVFPTELLDGMEAALAQAETTRVVHELPGGPPSLAASIAVVRDEGGEAVGVVAVVRDITEAKNLQERMSDFVSMVAHELRSPLGAISQYIDVILRGTVQGQPEREEEILARCRTRLGALSQLVADLLEFARVRRRQEAQERALAPLDITQVAREVVEFASQGAASREVTISFGLPADLPKVEADRDELLRLLTNLIDNAIKYNRRGGSVSVRGSFSDGYVSLEVADTGLGIPQDQLSRLGEAFFRVKTPETAQITGTGLGLSICKQIVEAHDGHLEMDSTEGEGTTFRVLLPQRHLAASADVGSSGDVQ